MKKLLFAIFVVTTIISFTSCSNKKEQDKAKKQVEKDIENIIKMLDEASATTARINLNVAEDGNDGEIRKLKHHGRCDVGSAWATGKVKNPECVDAPMLDEESK